MSVNVKRFNPSREKVYISPEEFLAVDEETGIGVWAVNGNVHFVGYNSFTDQYDKDGFRHTALEGKLTVDVIQRLLKAYHEAREDGQ